LPFHDKENGTSVGATYNSSASAGSYNSGCPEASYRGGGGYSAHPNNQAFAGQASSYGYSTPPPDGCYATGPASFTPIGPADAAGPGGGGGGSGSGGGGGNNGFAQPRPAVRAVGSTARKRAAYKCRKCGVPKFGHICPYDTRIHGNSALPAPADATK
jgi:hypothetical protein